MARYKLWTPIGCGFLSGVLLMLCFLYVSFIYSIHGGFNVAGKLFPFAVILSPSLREVTGLSLLLAAIQWPFYGTVVAVAWVVDRKRIFGICVIALVIVHFVAAVLAKHYISLVPLIKYPQ